MCPSPPAPLAAQDMLRSDGVLHVSDAEPEVPEDEATSPSIVPGYLLPGEPRRRDARAEPGCKGCASLRWLRRLVGARGWDACWRSTLRPGWRAAGEGCRLAPGQMMALLDAAFDRWVLGRR